jgi:hypothetical protein
MWAEVELSAYDASHWGEGGILRLAKQETLWRSCGDLVSNGSGPVTLSLFVHDLTSSPLFF